jgi:acetyl esterase/lipase
MRAIQTTIYQESQKSLASERPWCGRVRCVMVEYRLAPEHPYPAALNDALEAYEHVLNLVPSSRVVVAGDSAGGGLALALLVELRARVRPMAAAGLCLSPLVRLRRGKESMQEEEQAWTRGRADSTECVVPACFLPDGVDYILPHQIHAVPSLYLPDGVDASAGSPLDSALHRLPPLLLQVA